MAHRINTITVFIGARGTGKTTELLRVATNHHKKVLIVDTFDNPGYKHIPVIDHQKIKTWKHDSKAVYRCYGSEIEEIIKSVQNHLNNCLLVFEDAGKYVGTKISNQVKRIVIDSKQKNIDIIFMFHAWGFTPLDLYKFCDYLVMFKTNDTPESRKKHLPNYNQISRAHQSIMQSPVKWKNQTIPIGT